jgi:4-aminobutyrate aminotransferase-like enzyme
VTDDDLRARRAATLGTALSLSYREPLHIVRGLGAYLYDADGRAYLDAVNNVAHVGHSHPRVVEAASRQMALLNTNTRYLHETLVAYAERLAALLPDGLEVVWLTNSGSEANELALRLARAATGRRDVAVHDGAYHGNTTGLVDIIPNKFAGPRGDGRPPHVHVAPLPDAYRGRRRDDGAPTAATGTAYADDLAATLREATQRGHPPGAVIAESFPGSAGQVIPPPGFLAGAFDHARAHGAIAIADEVQTGFGRVGAPDWWAFAVQGASPDVVTLGKPIGNGHPLGAVITTRAVADAFARGPEYFNTFGGNPVAAAVGMAVLDVLEEEHLRERAASTGARLLEGFRRLATEHEAIGDVRGVGMFLGLVLVTDRATRDPDAPLAEAVVEHAKSRGVLLSTDGLDHEVLKVKPPLVWGDAEADRLLEVLDEALQLARR